MDVQLHARDFNLYYPDGGYIFACVCLTDDNDGRCSNVNIATTKTSAPLINGYAARKLRCSSATLLSATLLVSYAARRLRCPSIPTRCRYVARRCYVVRLTQC
ncbi:hypothetical protein KGM_208367 [Danaus plexippus plexippus]|uniref:Uncharacterized protein n=1 Tax=Danaus plexippus plexippus TaxID=278856 RepID=A0A212FKL9_DANPL|nr:hypothetical protein KGM_208367 [Danaus plexippus plexippus]